MVKHESKLYLKPSDLGIFENVPEIIEYVAKEFSDRIAVSTYDANAKTIDKTYADLRADVSKFAGHLSTYNVNLFPICLMGDTSYEWMVAFYGIMWSGAVPVLVENDMSALEAYDLISETGAKLAIFDNGKKKADLMEVLSSNEIGFIGLKDDLRKLLSTQEIAPIPCVKRPPDDTALIVFTSGTTGKNKGVMLSHKNVCSNLFYSMISSGNRTHHSNVTVLPPHHMYQIILGILSPIYLGTTTCIGRGRKYLSQDIEFFKPSTLILVPAAIEMMRKTIWANARLQNSDVKLRKAMKVTNFLLKLGIDVRRKLFAKIHNGLGGELHTIISGGAPIDPETILEFKAWDITIINGYGVTECSPVISSNTFDHERLGSVGKADFPPYSTVRIIDGEICVKGDNVMKGYLGDEKATAEAIKDGWYATGDLGYIDKDGYLFITGRKKNLIILSNGENVSPEELEFFYDKIDGVKDVLVFEKKVGRESILSAMVVPTDELIAKKIDMQKYFNQEFDKLNPSLPQYKQVHEVRVRETEFIKSSNLKIKRIEENYIVC